jgi:predicted nucleotidyltransferase component of viral defense system
MLTIEQIRAYFPEPVFRQSPQAALVEYLQHELLDSLFKEPGAAHVSFIGGTAIRILHGSLRFSEDLDFDNFGLSFTDFELLLGKACRDMEYKGFIVEYRLVESGAYHCHIRFPELLFKTGISPDKGRKILVRVDAEAKDRHYAPKTTLLNRFGVFRRIITAPVEILLAQKMLTVLFRKREKGRDLYDVSFLMGMTTPDHDYIRKTLGADKPEFIRMFTRRLDELDLDFLARDVEPFLIDAHQKERVLYFREAWRESKI